MISITLPLYITASVILFIAALKEDIGVTGSILVALLWPILISAVILMAIKNGILQRREDK